VNNKIIIKDSVAIIPARKGSKRIPGKNIKLFYGKPIIYYAIKKAKESGLFSKILVTTDSKKIAYISKKFGASVEFLRPKYLSNDKAGTIEVISHSVNYLKKKNFFCRYVCCIYPTTPLINLKIFKSCYRILKSNNFNYVFPVSNHRATNNTCLLLNKNHTVKKKIRTKEKNFSTPFCNDTGQYYWGKFNSWLYKKKLFTSKSRVILLKKNDFVDVNTLQDWIDLENLYKKFHRS
jgi:N-acylneuraminate cytidylyltransferase